MFITVASTGRFSDSSEMFIVYISSELTLYNSIFDACSLIISVVGIFMNPYLYFNLAVVASHSLSAGRQVVRSVLCPAT
jgi:hypothetical protein